MIPWLRDNYGWKAKRTEYIWVVVIAVLLIALVTIGPIIVGLF